jgi:hypothetical protein
VDTDGYYFATEFEQYMCGWGRQDMFTRFLSVNIIKITWKGKKKGDSGMLNYILSRSSWRCHTLRASAGHDASGVT